MTAMSIRTQKFIGMLAFLIGLFAYCGFIVWVAVEFIPQNVAIELVFYIVAGLLWLVPARWLVLKINREND